MSNRRVVLLLVLTLALAILAVLSSVPRFANTRQKAQQAAERAARLQAAYEVAAPPAASQARAAGRTADAGALRRISVADSASVPGVPGRAAALLRLPTATELLAEVPPDTNRLLIRTGQANIEVDSLEPAVARVRQIAAAVGGYVANAATRSTEANRSASLEIKIPAPRFDQALDRLKSVGKLEAVNVTVQDVGEEYVDVAARMANAQRLEVRLINLLATRTGRLQDVLDVERELARVREEIERYAGRLQFLRAQAALSTLTVTLYEPGTVVGSQPGLGVIGDAFGQAWRNFIAVIAFLVQMLGVVLPLGVVAVGGWLAWKRFGTRDA